MALRDLARRRQERRWVPAGVGTVAWLSVVYLVDLALFVLVFWIIRSRRASVGLKTTVILTAVVLYLASLVALIFISAKQL